jgi:hypothetical protein
MSDELETQLSSYLSQNDLNEKIQKSENVK